MQSRTRLKHGLAVCAIAAVAVAVLTALNLTGPDGPPVRPFAAEVTPDVPPSIRRRRRR